MHINVREGIGYIEELNGNIYIYFSKDSFKPAIDWFKEDIEIRIKNLGNRYVKNRFENFPSFENETDKDLKHIVNCVTLGECIHHLLKELKETLNLFSLLNSEIENLVKKEQIPLGNLTEISEYAKSDLNSTKDSIRKIDSLLADIENTLKQNSFIECEEKILKGFKQIELEVTPLIEIISRLRNKGDHRDNISYEIKSIYYEAYLLEKSLLSWIYRVAKITKETIKKRFVLLIGEAMIGKTHTICEIATERVNSGQPTILVFGHEIKNANDPIEGIIKALGLKVSSYDDFLQKINQWGKSLNQRVLIIIDAINETRDKSIWRDNLIKFIERIKKYPYIAVLLTVRDTERGKIISQEHKEYVEKEFLTIHHRGLEGVGYQALYTFCGILDIEIPKIPLYYKLCYNPGLLFLLLEIYKELGNNNINYKNLTPTYLFDSYLKFLNQKYCQKYCQKYNKESHLNWIKKKGIKYLLDYLNASNIKKWDDITFTFDEAYLNADNETREILDFLIEEGLLNEFYDGDNSFISFTYQRFENYFLIDYLLTDYEKNKNTILQILKSYNVSLIEAIFVQLPEKLEKEVFDEFPELEKSEIYYDYFLSSLIWRSYRTISERTLEILRKVKEKGYVGRYFETVLQLSTIPNHPLNILRLHQELKVLKMPERDFHWSIFLHENFSNDDLSPIRRIIDWALGKENNTEIDEQSLFLYGITLSWFLTSSNRTIRDKSTKALVNLYTNRVREFINILKEFEDVDDLYVLERLYAVAYGITLRSQNREGFRELSEYIYEKIFNQENIIEHLLLRDYAKGTLEAILQEVNLDLDREKIEPPYNQHIDWDIELEDFSVVDKLSKDEKYFCLENSILYDITQFPGDFGKYIINPAVDNWFKYRLSDNWKPLDEIKEEFLMGLNESQMNLWKEKNTLESELKSSFWKLGIYSSKSADSGKEKWLKELDLKISDLRKKISNLEKKFENSLSEKQKEIYSYIKANEDGYPKENHQFNTTLAQKWIFKEVLNLGWKPELFGEFDRYIRRNRYEDKKPERIGKKYQWIAFHKLLAKISDNYKFSEEKSWKCKTQKFLGAYQIWVRDIDPSTILSKKNEKDNWLKQHISYTFEKDLSYEDWLKMEEDLPPLEKLLNLTFDNKDYLLLNTLFSLKENKNFEEPYRDLFLGITSYLIRKEDIEKIRPWVEKQNFYGRWMPEPSDITCSHMFLREYPYFSAYRYLESSYLEGWTDLDGRIPAKILRTSEIIYLAEGNTRDASLEDTINIYLPNKIFIEKLSLQQTLEDGVFVDTTGRKILFDPSVKLGYPSALLADKEKLYQFLEENNLSLFWAILGEKIVMESKEKIYPIAKISGFALLDKLNRLSYRYNYYSLE